MNGAYDIGDTFVQDLTPTDLDLYLMHNGDTMLSQRLTRSNSGEMSVEHIFFEVPTTGLYELWVHQFSSNFGAGQNYALAWWGVTLPGDYNGDGVVSGLDYDKWKMDYGSTTNLAADGNLDGTVNAADYAVWRNNLGSMLGSGGSVPEPAAVTLLFVGIVIAASRRSYSRS